IQISVRGREHAHVDWYGPIPADPFELAFLKNSQQRHLRLRWQFSDFVQENGSAVRRFKAARAPLQRSSEGALLMSKKFGGNQRGWNRGAVHPNESAIGALGAIMNRARNQLLASAGLALDQNRGIGGSDSRHLLQYFAN